MKDEVKIAFFDFDETVISFKSMFSFLQFFLKEQYPEDGENRFRSYMNDVKNKWLNNIPREAINSDYYQQFKGESKDKLLSVRDRWILQEKGLYGNCFYIKETIKLIRRYQENNTSIVIVSGSIQDIIEPLAYEIGADAVLATKMKINNGVYTGEFVAPQTIGQGKALAITHYMQEHEVEKQHTVAWGDHESDYPMLYAAGHGGIVSKDLQTLSAAQSKGFSVIKIE